ncbi:MAG: adenylosuccinate lyase [Gammaproteobacteria bacterium]|nr:adenylosuccinate lyase [Gammaproteobacteria bacterium]
MKNRTQRTLHLQPLTAISPVDGRYAEQVAELGPIFSEYGLIRRRVLIEVRWLQLLAAASRIREIRPFSDRAGRILESIVTRFDIEDARRVKDLEGATHHDVKAVEYFLKEKVAGNRELAGASEFFHFGCTSEDINNLAHGLMLAEARTVLIKAIEKFQHAVAASAQKVAGMPMLSRTHGQPASPTTLGKELAVFVHRIQKQIDSFRAVRILGKMNGAVGNFNAHLAACPELDWMKLSDRFVSSLGLEWNPHTTQIESHDYMAEYFHALIRLNTILVDFCRDTWGYIALGYFRQRPAGDEVGSSTMPHKVNPIDFENAEGNLTLANSLLHHMAEKLPVSRWQRDLSDSTTLRNMGTAVAHSLIAWRACLRGVDRLEADPGALQRDLDRNWEVLAEAIQTVMRRYGIAHAYEQLRELTRGGKLDAESVHGFVEKLNLPAGARKRLLKLTPATYTGNAEEQALSIIRTVLKQGARRPSA